MKRGLERSIFALLLALVPAAGCDAPPFEPFEPNTSGAFSLFGYLDLYADTQWVRVTPVRQDLLPSAQQIDAVVTLEDLGSGRVVSLESRIFTFRDVNLDTVAYAHDFWTAEPLAPGATYVLKAVRSDGVASSVRILMPEEIEMSLQHGRYREGSPEAGTLLVSAERVPFVDMLYLLRDVCTEEDDTESVEQQASATSRAPIFSYSISADTLRAPCTRDLRRQEIRVTTAPASWPYDRSLGDFEIAVPNTATSNVENGLGFVGGVAIATIPFSRCEVLAQVPGVEPCALTYDARSASISGVVRRSQCAEPVQLTQVRLVEEFTGGTVAHFWKTGLDGSYSFAGLRPGSQLTVQVGTSSPLDLPVLGTGERYAVPDISLSGAC